MIRLYSASLYGLEAKIIEVEIDKSGGLFSFSIVGLPDKAIQESKERVFLAIKNLGAKKISSFNQKFVVNLAPADLKKEGAFFDLPIALGLLSLTSQIKDFKTSDKIFIGELSLEGKVRKIKGALPIALKAKK
ncbi:MAG TPA: magnesium chelatase, partial [bacterium]|nr:magnesium chelatase [bacterium]